METLEEICFRIKTALPAARVEIIPNASPCGQRSLLLGREQGLAVATFLRDDPQLRLDYCSNVTGVDRLEPSLPQGFVQSPSSAGLKKEAGEGLGESGTGCLEAVYHLFSMAHKNGPVVLRLRTENRLAAVRLPSLTPVWRSCEFQEREIFDLFGIVFDGHPDLRRLLMWEGFQGFPMRRDYLVADDFECEPTPHGDVPKRMSPRQGCAEVIQKTATADPRV
jgi:NADH-quinone oxidoreductase subunit C